jgi:hypothetical protein
MPSTTGYMVAAGITAAALFFVLWWMLHTSGDEVPWFPAGLAACVVMLVAAAARQVVMRRAWTRYVVDQDRFGQSSLKSSGKRKNGSGTAEAHAAQLRNLQKHSAKADTPGATPEAHLETYQLCKEYQASTEQTLRHGGGSSETRAALRAGQERVRAIQKHHLLAWASTSSRAITLEAQRRLLYSDKIETAMRALEVIDAALKVYPDEAELHKSVEAINEFITSVKVGRWVEMAERAAFKGYYRRAIDRYQDALYYLSREPFNEESRAEIAEQIGRKIELLRACLKTSRKGSKPDIDASVKQPRKRRVAKSD